jgi:hypothetical protein
MANKDNWDETQHFQLWANIKYSLIIKLNNKNSDYYK